MDRYHLIRHVFGGSDVYDENGNQVGYSLPSMGGEDFYDMDGNPVGMSIETDFGGEGFMGIGNGTSGFMDEEILMGRNAWLNGNPFMKEEEPFLPDMDAGVSGAGASEDPGIDDGGWGPDDE